MPPLDSRYIIEYAALFAGMAALFCLNLYFERSEQRRKAKLVHANLAAKRCARCHGTTSDWDGRFHPGDAHFY